MFLYSSPVNQTNPVNPYVSILTTSCATYLKFLTGEVLTTSCAISTKWWQYITNRFFQAELAGFQQTPIRIGICLMPNRQCLLGSVDRCAHVFAHPFFAHIPGFV